MDPIERIFFALCKGADTPRSLGAWLRYKYNQDALAEMRVRACDYLCAVDFVRDYVVTSFLSKYEGLRVSWDPAEVALQGFIASEETCTIYNDFISESWLAGSSPAVERAIVRAQRKIARILPDVSKVVDFAHGAWSGGATLTIPRRAASAGNKTAESPMSVTADAKQWLRRVIEEDPHWFAALSGVLPEGPFSVTDSLFSIVRGSKLETVPKDQRKGRVIRKEPTGNIWLQKSVGRVLRKVLKQQGVDLDDQTWNRFLASTAKDWALATLDLSSASDSITWAAIMLLLPPDWFDLLDQLRSPYYQSPDGEWYFSEGFASMGNGFTFELESLIFWALATSVDEVVEKGESAVVSVYGDDIIVPAEAASAVIEVLGTFGFSVNSEKSFVSGEFYESCGLHVWGNLDVTPAYIKKRLISSQGKLNVRNIVRVANKLLRLAARIGEWSDSSWIYPAWRAARSAVPSGFVTYLPFGVQRDDGLLCLQDAYPGVLLFDRETWTLRADARVFRDRPFKVRGRDDALLALRHREMSNRRQATYGPLYGVPWVRRVVSAGLGMPVSWPYVGAVGVGLKIDEDPFFECDELTRVREFMAEREVFNVESLHPQDDGADWGVRATEVVLGAAVICHPWDSLSC